MTKIFYFVLKQASLDGFKFRPASSILVKTKARWNRLESKSFAYRIMSSIYNMHTSKFKDPVDHSLESYSTVT